MSLSQQNAIEQNLQNVREKIAAAAQHCGRSPEEITLLEEEKIMAYFGAGTLYATPDRQEPLI